MGAVGAERTYDELDESNAVAKVRAKVRERSQASRFESCVEPGCACMAVSTFWVNQAR